MEEDFSDKQVIKVNLSEKIKSNIIFSVISGLILSDKTIFLSDKMICFCLMKWKQNVILPDQKMFWSIYLW